MDSRVTILKSDEPVQADLRWAEGVDQWQPDPTSDPPDRRLVLVADGKARGRVSIWWKNRPALKGESTAYVGEFAAAGPESLAPLLKASARLAADRGLKWIVGPIDGSTWRRYRSVVRSDGHSPFPMEPTNPPWWNDALAEAGFAVVERYWSGVRRLADIPLGNKAKFSPEVRVRGLDPQHVRDELDGIFDLAVSAFAANPLYAPIDRNTFVATYAAILEAVNTQFCLIVENADSGEPVGFVFSFPFEHNEGPLKLGATVVLKTAAVAQNLRGLGVGTELLMEVMRRAAESRLTTAIFALMHERNPSSRIARRMSKTLREYALYARRLGT